MKKIFTLALGLILTVAMFAADRKPTVTLNASRNYIILIDGKRFQADFGNTVNISTLFNGRHDVKVYEARQGFFKRAKKLVSTSTFQLKNKDVQINIDRFGQIQISESRFGRDWNDRDYGKDNGRNKGNDYDHDHDQKDHNRRF